MEEGDNSPCGIEAAAGCFQLFWRIVVLARHLHACDGSIGLACGGQFNYISNEERAWNEKIEDEAVNDVLARIVMAANAY